jgi:hypothetical protein
MNGYKDSFSSLSYLCCNGNVLGVGVAMETWPLGKIWALLKLSLK